LLTKRKSLAKYGNINSLLMEKAETLRVLREQNLKFENQKVL
jgi:hypothetical protein